MRLPLPVKALVRLLEKLQRPRQAKPNDLIPAVLQVQAISTARRVRQKHVHLSPVPRIGVVRAGQKANAKAASGQRLHNPLPIMLEIIKHKDRCSGQLVDKLHEGVQLAIMDRRGLVPVVIDGPVAKLEKFSRKDRRAPRVDRLRVDGQKHIPLQRVISFFGCRVEFHAADIGEAIRQGKIILGLHADAYIRQPFPYRAFAAAFRRP